MHDTNAGAPDRLSGWRRPALAGLAGALAALGLAPFDLWPMAIAGFAAILALAAGATGLRGAAWTGWAAGAGYFAVALHWIVEPFLVDIARHGWMAPFALVFMAGGLALFWALAAGLAALRLPAGGWRLAALVPALALAEMLRGVVFTGFPWALIGHGLIASPLVHFATLGGPDGLSLILLALAGALAMVPRRPVPAVAAVAVLAAGLFAAVPLVRTVVTAPAPDAPVVRLMQPNAPQHQKWDARMMPVFLDRMIGFSATPPAPDVIVWPETSVPSYLDIAQGLLGAIAGQAQGATSVVGIERREDGRYYNSLAVIGPDGAIGDVYDKHHLVPFGEYLPLGDVLSRFGLGPVVQRYGAFAAGPGPQLVDLGEGMGRALPLICYEAVFPRDVAGAPERPDILLQITNDAWFGTFSGPYQHLAQARLRSIEQGLPLLRAANTGITAAIAADGEIIESIPLGEAGFIDVPRPIPAKPTYYADRGAKMTVFSVLAWLLGVVSLRLVVLRASRD